MIRTDAVGRSVSRFLLAGISFAAVAKMITVAPRLLNADSDLGVAVGGVLLSVIVGTVSVVASLGAPRARNTFHSSRDAPLRGRTIVAPGGAGDQDLTAARISLSRRNRW